MLICLLIPVYWETRHPSHVTAAVTNAVRRAVLTITRYRSERAERRLSVAIHLSEEDNHADAEAQHDQTNDQEVGHAQGRCTPRARTHCHTAARGMHRCGRPAQPEARLQNATDATVEVYLETDDFSTLVNTIDPGEEGSARVSFGESGCQTNPLVARTTDGVEVDRHEGICVDEVWVIDGDEE